MALATEAPVEMTMSQRRDYLTLPTDLPVPTDDGATDHLTGFHLPSIPLTATNGDTVDLAQIRRRTIIYIYPRTGTPDAEPPGGEVAWNAIPGARGCTPESCAFRDHYAELQALGSDVYGLSTQTANEQREVASRLHLPFPLLSDADLALTRALRLPTFEVDGHSLIKRLTLVIADGQVEHVFYPVFPPDRHAEQVLAWLEAAEPPARLSAGDGSTSGRCGRR